MTTLRILVPLDGSPFAESALPAAVSLANQVDADLDLAIVYDDEPTVGGWPLDAEGVGEWCLTYLESVAERVRRHTPRPVTVSVISGRRVAETLERYAVGSSAGLTVMSTHGRGPVTRAWLGSVADHMVRHGSTPVLLVRPDPDRVPSFETPVAFRRILVPLDGSVLAEEALPWARRIAGGREAHLTLLRAVPPPLNVQSPYLPHTIERTREIIDQGSAEASRYLAQAGSEFARNGTTVATELQVGVRPATAILHYADRHPVDLIAIATHGRGGMTRTVLGSVADKVVRGAHVPVLLVRAALPSTTEGVPAHEGTDQLVRNGADG